MRQNAPQTVNCFKIFPGGGGGGGGGGMPPDPPSYGRALRGPSRKYLDETLTKM